MLVNFMMTVVLSFLWAVSGLASPVGHAGEDRVVRKVPKILRVLPSDEENNMSFVVNSQGGSLSSRGRTFARRVKGGKSKLQTEQNVRKMAPTNCIAFHQKNGGDPTIAAERGVLAYRDFATKAEADVGFAELQHGIAAAYQFESGSEVARYGFLKEHEISALADLCNSKASRPELSPVPPPAFAPPPPVGALPPPASAPPPSPSPAASSAPSPAPSPSPSPAPSPYPTLYPTAAKTCWTGYNVGSVSVLEEPTTCLMQRWIEGSCGTNEDYTRFKSGRTSIATEQECADECSVFNACTEATCGYDGGWCNGYIWEERVTTCIWYWHHDNGTPTEACVPASTAFTFQRSTIGEKCSSYSDADILRVFTPADQSTEQFEVVRNACEAYCFETEACNACTPSCVLSDDAVWVDCVWRAIPNCSEQMDWQGLIDGEVSVKVAIETLISPPTPMPTPANIDYARFEDQLCPAASRYTSNPVIDCNGWINITEDACWQMCKQNVQAPNCPQKTCEASAYYPKGKWCHLYDSCTILESSTYPRVTTRRPFGGGP